MPQFYSEYAVGYREVVYFVPEVTYGVPVHPSPIHSATIQTASFEFTHERVNRADKTTSRSYRERISHRKSVTWSVTLYLMPSGTNGVAPDITDALAAGMGIYRVVPNTTAESGSTASKITAAAAAGVNYEVGDGLGWVNAVGELEATFIESITGDELTISPPFSVLPPVAAPIVGGITYKLGNNLGSLCITRILDNVTTVYSGCFCNDITFDFPGEGEGTITVGGEGKTEFSSGVSSLGLALDGASLTVAVAVGEGGRFQANTRVSINPDGANTEEVVLITAVVGDNLTVTRAQAGTTAGTHGVGAVIGPYQPPQTTSGSPISGTIGEFYILTGVPPTRALSTYKLQTANITVNNSGSLRNTQYGQDSATGFFVNKREVNFSSSMWLEKAQIKLYNNAKQFVMQEIMIQLGKTLGNVVAAKMDRAEFNTPGIDGGGDEEVVMSFEGMALGSLSGGNDELFVAFL